MSKNVKAKVGGMCVPSDKLPIKRAEAVVPNWTRPIKDDVRLAISGKDNIALAGAGGTITAKPSDEAHTPSQKLISPVIVCFNPGVRPFYRQTRCTKYYQY